MPEHLGYFWWLVEHRPRSLTRPRRLHRRIRQRLLIDRDAGHAAIVLVNVGREPGRYALRYLVDADHDD